MTRPFPLPLLAVVVAGILVIVPCGRAFCQPFVTAVGADAKILRTNDGGVNWTLQHTAVNPDAAQRDLFAVDIVDPETGWTSGMFRLADTNSYYYTMRYTVNGGTDWPSADFGPFQFGFLVHGLDFINHNTGWVVGGGGGGSNIWHSDDGGLTWSPQASGEGNKDLFAVRFVDGTRGWAVGSSGTVVHTFDGGASWHTQRSTSTTDTLLGADFVDENTGWAVGSNNILIHTMDGGNTWTTQSHPFADSLRDVTFPTSTDGWIVGSNGTILHTNDGGTSWLVQVSGTMASLNAVDFIDPFNGWAAGEAGTILHTGDGGLTWQLQASGTDRTLYDIAAVVPEPSAATMLLPIGTAIASFLRRRPLHDDR